MRYLLLMLLMLLLSFPATAETVIAAGDPWPPFLDPKHPQRGVATAIARAAYKTQGYDLELEFMPWARALGGVRHGKFDVLIGAWKTQERQAYLHYSKPYLSNEIKFIKRKDDPFEFKGLPSLAGKVVGTVRGYGYGDAFEQSQLFSREPATELVMNIRKLVIGRVDLALEDELVARSLLQSDAPQLIPQVEFVATPLSSNELHVACGIKNPRHEALIEAFNRGLDEIRKNGTFDQIMQHNGLTAD